MSNKTTEMTENEITNFAFNFMNLIRQKNATITELQTQVKELSNQLRSIKPVRLTKEEVQQVDCPVWVVPGNRYQNGFYALPITGGVISNNGGRYIINNYEKTWVAYSTKPSKEEDTPQNDNKV